MNLSSNIIDKYVYTYTRQYVFKNCCSILVRFNTTWTANGNAVKSPEMFQNNQKTKKSGRIKIFNQCTPCSQTPRVFSSEKTACQDSNSAPLGHQWGWGHRQGWGHAREVWQQIVAADRGSHVLSCPSPMPSLCLSPSTSP